MKEEIAKQVQVYAYNNTQQILQFAQTEKVIYGSSRLGTNFNPIPLFASQNSTQPVLFITHNIGLSTYELTNHLGNVLSVISDKPIPHDNNGTVDYYMADIRHSQDYSPFGVTLHGRDLSLISTGNVPYNYGFNGMIKDDEIKDGGNSYDFGARMLDPRLGRWLTVDAKASKYPMDSPYMAFGNNPICIIDPDGKEKIVVVGSDNEKWNMKFLLTGMRSARDLKNQSKNENVTLLLFKAGYSDKQIERAQKYLNKKGVKIQVVTSSDDVVNYVNNKSITTTASGRKEDPISRINIFAHGRPGQLMFGYHQGGTTEDSYLFETSDVARLQKSAFKVSAQIFSYACRTGAGRDVQEEGVDNSDTDPEKSMAQELANHLGVIVYALQKRSDYGYILPTEPMETTIGRKLGIIDDDKRFNMEGEGSIWDTDEGINNIDMPTDGWTPAGSPGWTEFKKGTTPKEL